MYKPLQKNNILLRVADSIVTIATPKNISSLWRFGSLARLCLVTQIITGLFLSIYFAADTSLSFSSAVYISRDVNYGWLIRRIHANGASIFFLCLYIHTGRGLYYGSYKFKEAWSIGVTLLLLTIIAAFLGYVLPWGQISYWAATVITNLVSAIPYLGTDVVKWLWGGFSVSNATLTRFYTFHFLFPILIAALVIIHVLFLYEKGHGNPLGITTDNDIIKFHPYFSVKDIIGFFTIWTVLGIVVIFNPNILIDPENFIPADPLVTPTHIQPEWYFLPIYAILRSIPNKLGGVIALIISIAILYILPLTLKPGSSSAGFNIMLQISFWVLVTRFIVLIWIGSKPVEPPFETIGQIFTVIYFFIYLMLYISQSMFIKLIN